jgi:hypothetical protein
MTYPSIISAAGKEALGGGVSVGITATLQNAQLSFEDRPDPQESGTVTTQDLTGLVLTDSTALFQTNGVLRGATVYNRTSGATGTVFSVDSETQLTLSEALDGGDDIEFALGDSYSCHNTIQCNVSGGNLVAVDDLGAELDPIFPTAFTQVVRTASSSATTQNQESLEFSVFNGGVHVDPLSSYTGTTFPRGTGQEPVNNMADAAIIATARGFNKFYINNSLKQLDAGHWR